MVKPAFAEDLSFGLEPHSFAELDAVLGQELQEDAPEGSKDGPYEVDDFKLTVLGKGLWVGEKLDSVPAIVTEEFSSKVGWGLTGEWAQVLDTVGAVPWAAQGSLLGGCFPHGDTSDIELRG